MNILFELLSELKYQTKKSFTFDISSDEDKTPIVVTPFVSVEYPCQTYLVIETENQALCKVNNDYLKALALAFRKADFHESDMDKNTTLVITSARPDTEPLNSDAKVKIEDDPYYFKKYVFSYTSASERLATSFLEHRKTECANEFSYVTIVGFVDDLKRAQQNQTNLGKLATSFYQARETLAKKKESLDPLNDGMCPYCGYRWDSDKLLQEQFAATKPILENLLGGGNAMFDQSLERCRKYYADVFKERIAARIAYITNDHGVQLLAAFKDFKDFKLSVENCEPILKHLQTSEDTINFDIANIDLIESAIAEIKESIPSNYDALAIEHGFDKIYKECFSNDICLDSITVEKLKNKAKYVENQYYASFDQVRQKLDLMKQQCNKLEPLQTQMKTYHAALKKSIDSYQKLVIKQIEIPFFLYCSRLLQSYQGGQGVLIDSNDSKIRFTAPGGEHDILYTMSSGQLSAVLLAFSLVLNKIYSGNNFKTLFIDDPIQCMDDINMISFVELLRREFADSQIVLSTHEDTFANYIKYKFSKYNIRSQSITLKTDAQ